MKLHPLSRLKSYLKNPAAPSWSSQGIADIFNDLTGSMLEKQKTVFPIIDEAFLSDTPIINECQLQFIRDISIHSKIVVSRPGFKREDLEWLLISFKDKPTKHRAVMLYILLDEKHFSQKEKDTLIELTKGSVAESYIVF